MKAFEPGLLARAHRGFLYIDEVNLLEDHLVDLLLDVAASGENVVEREGLSIRHPAKFVLIGTGNPEEGELRPQLLDRFGLSVEVKTPEDAKTRIEVVRRRDDFERDPAAFVRALEEGGCTHPPAHRGGARTDRRGHGSGCGAGTRDSSCACALGTDGLRGELTMMRAARALASLDGETVVGDSQLRRVAPFGAAAPAAAQSARRGRVERAGRSGRSMNCSRHE